MRNAEFDKEEVLRFRNDNSIPHHDTFIYDYLEGHFEQFKEEVEKFIEVHLKDEANNQDKNGTVTSSLTESQIETLWEKLMGKYIDGSTSLNDFKRIFIGDENEKIKPIVWILKSTKNKNVINKKTLFELFLMLRERGLIDYSKDSHLFYFVYKNFIEDDNKNIKLTAANKPIPNTFSENRLELEKIINSL